jgi:hypothetical protein
VITFAIYLILMMASGYGILKGFGRLTGIDAMTVLSWTIRSSMARGKQPVRPLGYGAIGCYVLAFTLLFVFIYKIPLQTVYLNFRHVGGLLGFRTGLDAWCYDPRQGGYVSYAFFDAPLPAETFADAFDVVVFYNQPGSEFYQGVGLLSWPASTMVVLASALCLWALYMMLYKGTVEYTDRNQLAGPPSHRVLMGRFKDKARLPWWAWVSALAGGLALIILAGALSIARLHHHYGRLFDSERKALRTELLQKTSPQTELTGYVVARYEETISETQSKRSGRRTREQTTYYTLLHYSVEFRDLLRIPVYLDLVAVPGSGVDTTLRRPFPNAWKWAPATVERYPFVVNEDYSISLRSEK